MEDENGGIFVPKGFVPTIRWKTKQPSTIKDEKWVVLDRKAHGTMRLCLASSVDLNISK